MSPPGVWVHETPDLVRSLEGVVQVNPLKRGLYSLKHIACNLGSTKLRFPSHVPDALSRCQPAEVQAQAPPRGPLGSCDAFGALVLVDWSCLGSSVVPGTSVAMNNAAHLTVVMVSITGCNPQPLFCIPQSNSRLCFLLRNVSL